MPRPAASSTAVVAAAVAAATAAAAGHRRHRRTPPQPTPLATPRPTGSTPQCRRRCGATLTPTGGEAEDAVGRMLAGPTEFACTVTAQVRRSGHSVSELQLQPGRRDPTFRATLPRVRGCSFVSYIGMSCQDSGCGSAAFFCFCSFIEKPTARTRFFFVFVPAPNTQTHCGHTHDTGGGISKISAK